MKSEKVRLYTIEITLIIFFLLAMIFNNVITRPVIAIVLLVFMVISKLLIKSGKQTLTTSTQITVLLIGIGLIYVILLYMLGIFTGFYTSTVQLSIWSIWNYIIPYIVIIISAENIRKTLLLKEAKKIGCKTINGIGMMIYQGAEAFKLWTGMEMPIDTVKDALNLK